MVARDRVVEGKWMTVKVQTFSCKMKKFMKYDTYSMVTIANSNILYI